MRLQSNQFTSIPIQGNSHYEFEIGEIPSQRGGISDFLLQPLKSARPIQSCCSSCPSVLGKGKREAAREDTMELLCSSANAAGEKEEKEEKIANEKAFKAPRPVGNSKLIAVTHAKTIRSSNLIELFAKTQKFRCRLSCWWISGCSKQGMSRRIFFPSFSLFRSGQPWHTARASPNEASPFGDRLRPRTHDYIESRLGWKLWRWFPMSPLCYILYQT